jgi:hypothetical protein
MNSKESGVALPALLFLYELIFVFPSAWRNKTTRRWLRSIAPLFLALALMALVFVDRVNRTPELQMTPAYRPHASISLWLTRVAGYFGILTYHHVPFTALGCGLLLGVMAATAIAFRNRAMIFGLAFFVVTITPVALISSRPGYVLYVPDLGLGLFFEAAIASLAAFACVVSSTGPPFRPPVFTGVPPYGTVPAGLSCPAAQQQTAFVTDEIPQAAWDLAFNLRLLYSDRSILVHPSGAPPDQQPDPRSIRSNTITFSRQSPAIMRNWITVTLSNRFAFISCVITPWGVKWMEDTAISEPISFQA